MLASIATVFAGCAGQDAKTTVASLPHVSEVQSPLNGWLGWQASVSTMSSAQVKVTLTEQAEPHSADELFYFALLQQGLETYNGWVMARDMFRRLRLDETLAPEQRQLAGILEQYNQVRINCYHSNEELLRENEAVQKQLSEMSQQNVLLEQRIKAISDLEATISTRRED